SSTVQITLSEPFAPFITILGLPHMSVIPREEVEQLGADFASAPVGTGPFRFVRWERGREIVLEANRDYFRGRPALDRIRFVIFPGNVVSEMVQAFERGELEETPMSPERREELLRPGKYIVVRKPTLSLRLLGFNLKHAPFDRREVRQAFNYAVDKLHLNQEIQEKPFAVAKGILPPGMPGYNPEVQGYSYDPDRARELLVQAGYPEGKGPAPVTLASGAKSVVARQDYRAVQQYLAAVGVQVEFKEFDDWPTFRQALQRGEHQIFRFVRYADYPDPDNFLYPLFHSQSQTNYFRYHNPLVDRLLEDARREMDDLRRAGLYREAEQLILNDAPGVMLQHLTFEELFQPYVEGIEVSALGGWYIPMRKIRLKSDSQPSAKK
ncbi:MAG: ABC transporter substrate-binding protein, partial [Candidatus Entotheonellia bacterium]